MLGWAMAPRYRRFLFAGLGLLAASGVVAPAQADARLCRQLEARLAALPSSRDGTSLYQRYEKAVAEQQGELAIANGRAGALGCGTVERSGNAQCQSLNGKIESMEVNLIDLERKLGILAKTVPSRGDPDRDSLLAAIEANGCGDRYQERLTELDRDEEALYDLLNRGSIEYLAPGQDEENVRVVPGVDHSLRAYRTMCVRTCDGYYFPMSQSSSRDDFVRDQQNCESICPGTEMRTYYQPSGDADVRRMMSTITDEPYPELGTAYLYRRADVERPQACGCGQLATEQNYSIIAGIGSAAVEESLAAPLIPRPWTRPDLTMDPETLANAEGKFGTRQIREILKPKVVKRPPAAERKVRVVGPTFLPDPPEAAGQPVPDPPKGP